MAKVDIFSRSSSKLGEGGGAWPHAYLGNANCWFTVDIIYQHLADSALTSPASCTVSEWSSDDALASPVTDSSRLERGVVADWPLLTGRIFLLDSLNDLQFKTCLISAM